MALTFEQLSELYERERRKNAALNSYTVGSADRVDRGGGSIWPWIVGGVGLPLALGGAGLAYYKMKKKRAELAKAKSDQEYNFTDAVKDVLSDTGSSVASGINALPGGPTLTSGISSVAGSVGGLGKSIGSAAQQAGSALRQGANAAVDTVLGPEGYFSGQRGGGLLKQGVQAASNAVGNTVQNAIRGIPNAAAAAGNQVLNTLGLVNNPSQKNNDPNSNNLAYGGSVPRYDAGGYAGPMVGLGLGAAGLAGGLGLLQHRPFKGKASPMNTYGGATLAGAGGLGVLASAIPLARRLQQDYMSDDLRQLQDVEPLDYPAGQQPTANQQPQANQLPHAEFFKSLAGKPLSEARRMYQAMLLNEKGYLTPTPEQLQEVTGIIDTAMPGNPTDIYQPPNYPAQAHGGVVPRYMQGGTQVPAAWGGLDFLKKLGSGIGWLANMGAASANPIGSSLADATERLATPPAQKADSTDEGTGGTSAPPAIDDFSDPRKWYNYYLSSGSGLAPIAGHALEAAGRYMQGDPYQSALGQMGYQLGSGLASMISNPLPSWLINAVSSINNWANRSGGAPQQAPQNSPGLWQSALSMLGGLGGNNTTSTNTTSTNTTSIPAQTTQAVPAQTQSNAWPWSVRGALKTVGTPLQAAGYLYGLGKRALGFSGDNYLSGIGRVVSGLGDATQAVQQQGGSGWRGALAGLANAGAGLIGSGMNAFGFNPWMKIGGILGGMALENAPDLMRWAAPYLKEGAIAAAPYVGSGIGKIAGGIAAPFKYGWNKLGQGYNWLTTPNEQVTPPAAAQLTPGGQNAAPQAAPSQSGYTPIPSNPLATGIPQQPAPQQQAQPAPQQQVQPVPPQQAPLSPGGQNIAPPTLSGPAPSANSTTTPNATGHNTAAPGPVPVNTSVLGQQASFTGGRYHPNTSVTYGRTPGQVNANIVPNPQSTQNPQSPQNPTHAYGGEVRRYAEGGDVPRYMYGGPDWLSYGARAIPGLAGIGLTADGIRRLRNASKDKRQDPSFGDIGSGVAEALGGVVGGTLGTVGVASAMPTLSERQKPIWDMLRARLASHNRISENDPRIDQVIAKLQRMNPDFDPATEGWRPEMLRGVSAGGTTPPQAPVQINQSLDIPNVAENTIPVEDIPTQAYGGQVPRYVSGYSPAQRGNREASASILGALGGAMGLMGGRSYAKSVLLDQIREALEKDELDRASILQAKELSQSNLPFTPQLLGPLIGGITGTALGYGLGD